MKLKQITIPWVHPLNKFSYTSNHNHNQCIQWNTNWRKQSAVVLHLTHLMQYFKFKWNINWNIDQS